MKKKKSKKKKMKDWEKKFIFFNILVIVIICSIYSYKLIYYYKLEHKDSFENMDNFYEALINSNIVYSGDGLYKVDEDNFYFKGVDVNNYLLYSGRMWRIIDIDSDGVKIITDNNQTSLVWGYNSDYLSSYIYKWLNITDNDYSGIFLNSLNNYSEYLVKNDFCYNFVDNDKYGCQKSNNDYVGLISIYEYMRSGGKDGFINNSEYFWTINASDSGKVWYVFDKGGINDESNDLVSYHTFGVRPVIKINKDALLISGNGTKDNPFVIENDTSIMLEHKSIGSYVKYDNYVWRINGINDDSIRLILDGLLENKLDYVSTINYLNGDFYNSIDHSKIKKCDFYNGNFGEDNNYDYASVYSKKISNYVGIPSLGELFITDYDNYWIYSSSNNANLMYTVNDLGRIYLDSVNNENYIRPSICIDKGLYVKDGNGTKDNPFIVEVLDETDN